MPAHFSTKLPLSLILIVPFVAQLVATVGLVGYFSFKNGQKAVENLAHQLLEVTGENTSQRLELLLEIPPLINQLNGDSIEAGQLDLTDLPALEQHFLQQIQSTPSLSRISFSNLAGGLVSAGRDHRGLSLAATDQFTQGTLQVYKVDSQGNRQERLVLQANYNAAQRPFHQSAVAAKKPIWTPIFTAVQPSLGLSLAASQPVYNSAGQLQGVLSSAFLLSVLDTYLQELSPAQELSTFILEPSGLLVASSSGEPLLGAGNRPQRLNALESQTALIRETAQHLLNNSAAASEIPTHLHLSLSDDRYFVQVLPFERDGLSWLVVIALPESAFMADIQANTRQTVLLCLATAIASVGLGLLIVRWISRPLQQLNQAAQQFAQGQFEVSAPVSAVAEMQGLGQSFATMAAQMQASLINLETHSRTLESQFNAFFQSAPIGMAVLDDQLRYVQINAVLAAANHQTQQAHIGQTLRQMVPTLADQIEPLYQAVLETGRPLLYKELSTNEPNQLGQQRHWIASYFPLPSAGDRPTYLGVVALDITHLKQLKLALQTSEAQLSSILNSAIAAIISYRVWPGLDPQPEPCCITGLNPRAWQYEFCSAGCESVFGYPPNAFTARPNLWRERIHPDDWQSVLVPRDLKLRTERVTTDQYRFLDADGRWRWIAETAACVWEAASEAWVVTVVSHDVSDRKGMEEQLRTSEAALAEAQRIGGIGSWSFDLASQTITWSDQMFRVFGLSPQVAAPSYSDFLQFVPLPDRQRLQALIENAIQTGQPYETEHPVDRLDGSQGWVFCRGEVLRDSQGNVVKLLGIGQDVTARKQTEIELEQAKEAAIREAARSAAANESKSLFLASMSHELRTPLNAILGFSELISANGQLACQERENLQIIQRSSEHLLNLINDVLDLSKIEAGRITLDESTVDLPRLGQGLYDLFYQQALDKGLQLHLAIAADSPAGFVADARKLRQVLINLLSNAVKFTPQGQVTLRISPGAIAPDAATQQGAASQLVFEVEDTGVGIAADELETIFEAFTQARAGRQAAQGTGLGLAICRQFAQLMGGDLTVTSCLGLGSCFRLWLPLKTAPEPLKVLPNRPIVGLANRRCEVRVLIVDDHPVNRQLLMMLMQRIGLVVREATNGEEAVAAWQQWSPHLIWMDLQMPRLNGYDATARIRQAESQHPQPRTVIIALTAQAFEEDRQQALTMGCDDYVTKPFQKAVLYSKLAEHLKLEYCYGEASMPALPREP